MPADSMNACHHRLSSVEVRKLTVHNAFVCDVHEQSTNAVFAPRERSGVLGAAFLKS